MRCVFASVLLLLTSAAIGEETPESTATKWLKDLGAKGLVVEEVVKAKDAGFEGEHGPSALGPRTAFRFQKPGWSVSVVCKGTHDSDTSLKTLQKNFWFATIDKMPTPGLAIEGWDIKPQTPSSHVTEGVELAEFADGKMKVVIKTKAFALYGRDTRVLVPADAGFPPGSYFQIRQPIPIDLTIAAPVEF